jgi:pimeloyl-ACP methyl ester carboxylesterase
VRLAIALAVLAVLVGCGGDTKTPPKATPTPAPPDVVRFCTDAGPGWTPLRVAAGGRSVDAAVIGKGDAVVLANQSDNDPCAWTATARQLAGDGHRVAVFRYGSTAAADEPAAVRETLAVADAAAGGGRAQLVGASLGGRIVFEAAAKAPGRLAAIVSLSGERTVEDYPDIIGAARRVTVPLLYLGSRYDPLTDGHRQPRQLQAAVRSRDARFEIVDGDEHGVGLLIHGALATELVAFLDQHR